ncbi:MAG: hypothetical protein IKT03_04350, partial [Muribaculaceae bacterium]|nr:hypothetical protein [Muribaculaceae bacterium]
SDLLFTLRNQLYDKILHLPLGYFTSQRRGDVVSRGVNDTHEIEFTIPLCIPGRRNCGMCHGNPLCS